MAKKNKESGASTSRRSERAHRSSAVKAKAFIKNALEVVSNEKVDGEESSEEGDESDAEVHYSLSSSSSEEVDDEDIAVERLPKNTENRDGQKPSTPKKLTAVQVERNKRELFNLWSDFIITPNSNLRKTSEMNFKWTHTSDHQKIAICPNTGCSQKFTTRQGLTYHFQRCGVLLQWFCKLCDYKAEHTKTLILHHLFDNHKSELPPTDPNLTGCLADNRKSAVKKKQKHTSAETQTSTVEFYQQNYEKPVFLNFLPRADIWIPLSEMEYSMCLPEVTVSPKFKIETMSSIDTNWQQLNLFESISKNDVFTCFVGGCVWAAAWCPLPLSETDDQYLAIATCRSNEKVHAMNQLENEYGLIQLWNCNELTKQTSPTHKPYFCLGIAHNYGIIWDMEWCPGGTSWQCSATNNGNNHLPRLGLLALACGDGIVRILSVPHPSSLKNTTRIYRCEPVVILDPPGTGPAFLNQSTICRSVSWHRTGEQRLIAAGFGSGVVAVWDLTAVSPILVIQRTSLQTILRPKETWIAHGAQINDLRWLPYTNQQLIVTVSFDRDMKVWNLDDLITPIFIMPRRSIFTKVDWSFKWCGVFAAFDDSYANWQASNYVIFKDAGFLDWPQNTLTPHRGCVWDFAVSEWLNAEVSVDSAGEVVVYTNFSIKHDMKSNRKHVERLPLYRMELRELTSTQMLSKKVKSKGKSKKGTIYVNWIIDREKPLQRTYNEMVDTYGIIFRDFVLTGDEKVPESELKRVRLATDMHYQRLSDYPLVSLTVVDWNPNINSFNWMLTAGQSGFLRIMRYHPQ